MQVVARGRVGGNTKPSAGSDHGSAGGQSLHVDCLLSEDLKYSEYIKTEMIEIESQQSERLKTPGFKPDGWTDGNPEREPLNSPPAEQRGVISLSIRRVSGVRGVDT